MEKKKVTAVATASSATGKKLEWTDDRSATVDFELPSTIDEAVSMWGEKVVLSKVIQQVIIDLQALIRRELYAGKTQAQIEERVASWKPGEAPKRKSRLEKSLSMIDDLDEDGLKEVLKYIRQKRG